MNVLAICGSLRQASFNHMAVRAAQKLAPEGMTISVADIGNIPLYNEDVRLAGPPEAVTQLREAVRAADALLFVSPEYNFSISGVLKNAIDWLSRPPSQPLDGKVAAIMGAATGMLGTARGQYHLRQILTGVNVYVVNKPEVFITNAASKFDAAGALTDEATQKVIADLLLALQKLHGKLG